MRTNPLNKLAREVKDDERCVAALRKSASFKPLKPIQRALESYGSEVNKVMDGLIATGIRPRDAVHQMITAAFTMGFNAGRAYEQDEK